MAERVIRVSHGRNAWRDTGKPRSYRTDQKCKAKRRFADEATARAHAMLAIEEVRNRVELWIYRCPHCGGWHLTHKKQGRRDLRVTATDPVATRADRA